MADYVRTKLSKLKSKVIGDIIVHEETNDAIYLVDQDGNRFAMINKDSLFDPNGMYFEDDVNA